MSPDLSTGLMRACAALMARRWMKLDGFNHEFPDVVSSFMGDGC